VRNFERTVHIRPSHFQARPVSENFWHMHDRTFITFLSVSSPYSKQRRLVVCRSTSGVQQWSDHIREGLQVVPGDIGFWLYAHRELRWISLDAKWSAWVGRLLLNCEGGNIRTVKVMWWSKGIRATFTFFIRTCRPMKCWLCKESRPQECCRCATKDVCLTQSKWL
jgi:hypothetical protein